MHRLVAYAHDGVRRFPVDRDVLVLGSGEGCDIRLPFSGIGEEHARLVRSDEGMEIQDLGSSRRGVLVNGERVRNARVRVLDEIRLGSIALLLEDTGAFPSEGAGPSSPERPREPRISPEVMLEHLARVSRWVSSESRSSEPLEGAIDALLDDFGGGVLFLFQGERGIKFVAATSGASLGAGSELLEQIPPAATGSTRDAGELDGTLLGEPARISWCRLEALDRDYMLLVALPRFRSRQWSPLSAFTTLADQLVLGLIHHVGRFEPLVLMRPPSSDLRLPPGLVTGESPAIRRLLSQLQLAAESPVPVHFSGEDGVSKELLARALHLSGPHAEGPFVVCVCSGERPETVEIDLFGALLSGREGPIARRGKLARADGGTLVLVDVDELSLAAQGRLVRVLRSGEIEPVGAPAAEYPPRPLTARVLSTGKGALAEAVARDRFRADLAHLLESLTLRVPSLRERREDLPLLIQSAVNRACHETGKRVQGITVDAMEALAGYDYPGNLPELQALVRRLVYLVPSGRAIDSHLLPESVRSRRFGPATVDEASELDLQRLVDECERRALREALRRSDGNKSAAARLLGLSRNGLNLKLKRLQIDASS